MNWDKLKGVRKVEMELQHNVEQVLEDLSHVSLNYESKCNESKLKYYELDFYFNINKQLKELIVIHSFINKCDTSKNNVNRFKEKLTIPIQKIKSVDIEYFDTSFVSGQPNEFCNIFINMKYDQASIKNEFIEIRGEKLNEGVKYESTLILNSRPEVALKIKKDIDDLIEEFKMYK